MSDNNEQSRLDTLEAHFVHQDRQLTELSDVITAQWRKIEALERQIQRLRGEVETMTITREGAEPPPPHY